MSIAALKRKTMNGNPRMSPISGSNGGPLGFALNGTRRISGVVGNTNLASDGPKNMQCCTNNSNIIKRSVMNTKGMLSSRYSNCITCPPKPIFQETVKDQDEHIKKLSVNCNLDDKITLRTYCGTDYSDEDKKLFKCHTNCDNKYIGGKNVFKGSYTKNPPGAISQSSYINGKYLKNRAYLLPTKDGGKCTPHFPPRVNNATCFTLYKTLNEMEAAKQI
jgi:hypothetical protein